LSWDLGTSGKNTPIDPPKPVWTDTEALIHAETQRAMDEQRIPSSPLAESVYKNYLRFPGCIVLTRVGKFYEVCVGLVKTGAGLTCQSYYDAALHLTSIIDLKVAVKRNNVRWVDGRRKPKSGNSQLQFPFAGFPYTQIDKYLKLLVQDMGHTVVLVEEDHVSEKDKEGLVKRAVGRVVTPGTLLDESWLNAHDSRYLLAISVSDKPGAMTDEPVPSVPLWLAYTDVSTGEFFSKDTTLAKLEDELTRIGPREVVLDKSFVPYWSNSNDIGSRDDHSTMGELFSLLRVLNPHVSFADTYLSPEIDGSPAKALDQAVLDANLEAQALSLLRHYVQYALRDYSPDLSEPQRQFDSAFMHIDAATLNGLEIKHSMRFGEGHRASPLSAKGTLLSVFDRTVTPSGHRLLVRTLSAPSTSIDTINHRLDLVQGFVEREDLREEIQETLKPLKDVVKLFQRVRQNRGDVDDIYEIATWIDGINRICDRISREARHERESTPASVASSSDDVGRKRLDHFVDSMYDLSELSRSIQLVIDADIVKSSRRPLFAPSGSFVNEDDEMPPEAESAEAQDVEQVEEDEGDEDGEEFPSGMSKANQELVKRFRRLELAFRQQWWIKPK
jgi:DNA mismatch repair ATPase MutS